METTKHYLSQTWLPRWRKHLRLAEIPNLAHYSKTPDKKALTSALFPRRKLPPLNFEKYFSLSQSYTTFSKISPMLSGPISARPSDFWSSLSRKAPPASKKSGTAASDRENCKFQMDARQSWLWSRFCSRLCACRSCFGRESVLNRASQEVLRGMCGTLRWIHRQIRSKRIVARCEVVSPVIDRQFALCARGNVKWMCLKVWGVYRMIPGRALGVMGLFPAACKPQSNQTVRLPQLSHLNRKFHAFIFKWRPMSIKKIMAKIILLVWNELPQVFKNTVAATVPTIKINLQIIRLFMFRLRFRADLLVFEIFTDWLLL